MDMLVSTDWLSRHLGDPDLVVLDCSVRTDEDEQTGFRNISGRAEYDAGHIPTAGFANLTAELCDTESPIEFALPAPERFAAVMGTLGVGEDCRVVLYDNSMMAWAARVWWMLRWIGFNEAALLDGGLGAWTREGRPLSTAQARHPARQLTPRLRADLIADKAEVLATIGDDRVTLVDTMPAPIYRGDQTMYARPGHIPGAINICGVDLLDETGRLRPLEDVAPLHTVDPGMRTITYCGGGILASLSAFTMIRMGYGDVAVYTASMQEWAADPELPLMIGPS
ncbi:MAG: sulfurtransferase [Hyphomicrobiales bacterium]|nr:sulfurtransferase [Hyphomicrobiales bacterium]